MDRSMLQDGQHVDGNWINVYDGDLGTVLTDTYTTDVFGDFSKKHAALFTSLRQDSGDPLALSTRLFAVMKSCGSIRD